MNALQRLLTLTLLLTGLAVPAHAQYVVTDPGNLVQNVLTATRALQQVNNQIHQLQNDAVMLQNQARNLHALNFNSLNDLRAALAATDRLIGEARGLVFEVNRVEEQFATLYPDTYAGTVTGSQLLTDAREHWRNSLEALRTAVRVQAQVQENFRTDESVLGDLVTRSQGAAGALEATQAGNQLLALSIRQQLQTQQLAISEGRAVATESARTVAAAERARAVRVKFLGDGTRYTPAAVEMFAP
ncbi:MAG: P-type conjugative transfer protein TrbJ [Gammaproteobacteria bacterium]